jgi:transposase InsO family protein
LEGGRRIQSLYPQGRSDNGVARSYDPETSLTLIRLRKELPTLSVPNFIKEVSVRKVLPPETELKQTTLYRFFHQQKIMTEKSVPAVDRRKFEAELPNDLWQSDVMHGPKLDCGGQRLRKTYLIAFIDDHSRLITHGRFYLAESLIYFNQAFEQALLVRGLPRKLYVDNGAAYRSKQLEFTCASLGIALIHAKPYTPQGKGKIERFFRTVRSQFLPCFKGASLEEINKAFEIWLSQDYQQRKHSSTGQSPFNRFTAHMECIRSAPRDLSDHFRKTVRRRVNKDRTVTIDNRLFEAPVELIGKRVELLYHESKPEVVEIKEGKTSKGNLQQIDLHINCRVKRDKNCQIELSPQESTPVTGELWEAK